MGGGSGAYGGAGAGNYAGSGGGACSAACGPACGGACDEVCGGGYDRYTQLGFVGAGGDYAPATYQYVGRGAGQYGIQETRIPRPGNCCCILLIPLAILLSLLLIPLLYYLLQPGTVAPTYPPTLAPQPQTTPLPSLPDIQEPVVIGSGDGPVAIGSGDGPIAIGSG